MFDVVGGMFCKSVKPSIILVIIIIIIIIIIILLAFFNQAAMGDQGPHGVPVCMTSSKRLSFQATAA